MVGSVAGKYRLMHGKRWSGCSSSQILPAVYANLRSCLLLGSVVLWHAEALLRQSVVEGVLVHLARKSSGLLGPFWQLQALQTSRIWL